MAFVAAGFLNKQVGARLGISEVTVKSHRGMVMRKMKAQSLPDLVRMAEALGRRPPASVYSPDMSKHAFLGTDSQLRAHNQEYAGEL